MNEALPDPEFRLQQEANIFALLANNHDWDIDPRFTKGYDQLIIANPDTNNPDTYINREDPQTTLPRSTAENPYFKYLVMKKYQRHHQDSKQTLRTYGVDDAVYALEHHDETPPNTDLHTKSLTETSYNFNQAVKDAVREYNTIDKMAKNGLMEIFSREALGAYSNWLLETAKQPDTNLVGLGIMFIDADNFSEYNNKVSHVFGDYVLKVVAQRMRENTDLPFRYGGEEIAIMIPIFANTGNHTRHPVSAADVGSLDFQRRFYDRMTRVYEQHLTNIPLDGGEVFNHVNTSAGLKLFSLEELRGIQNEEEMLKTVQALEKKSKADGKNRITTPPYPRRLSTDELKS